MSYDGEDWRTLWKRVENWTMRYRTKIGLVTVVVALLQVSAGKAVRASLPPTWTEVARFPTISTEDAAIGPDGRWHRVYLHIEDNDPPPRTVVYQSEAGEEIPLVTVPADHYVQKPSISVNARGDVLIAYTHSTWGTTARVLLRRQNQLQRWETTTAERSAEDNVGGTTGPFAPAYAIDVEMGRIDPDKSTVVLVHGWNGSSQTSLNIGDELSIWRRLAHAMTRKGVNVLAWDWLYEARTEGDGVIHVPGDPEHLRRQATLLLEQLWSLLGGVGQPIHLIGHSLGASIVAHTAASSDPDDGIGRVTLFDTVEHPLTSDDCDNNTVFCAPRQDLDIEVIPSIADEIAIDNYFSWSGCGYDNIGANGANVNLRNGSGFIWPDPRLHAYPRDWYLGTVADADKAIMYARDGQEMPGEHAGWWWSPTIGDNSSSANDWAQWREYELHEPLSASRCDRVVGTGNQGFLEGTWDQSGIVEEDGDIVTMREGSPAAISQTIDLEPQTVAIQFEYLFENGGDGDVLAVYWDEVLLWRRVGADFDGSAFVPSAPVDISAYRGTTGVLSFALESVGEANSVVMLRALEFSESACAGCFDLAVIVRGQGVVDPLGGLFPAGTSLDIEATPGMDWRFNRWEVDGPGGWETVQTINLVMNTHRSALAVFAPAHPADPTEDGDADLADVAVFQNCFGLEAAQGCAALDLSDDNMIGPDDVLLFTEALSGPYL